MKNATSPIAVASIAPSATKSDKVSFSAGFATDGTTPDALGRVRIALGPSFERVIPAGAAPAGFTKAGDVFTHKETLGPGKSFSVVVNFAKETVVVKAAGIEVGPVTEATDDFVLDLGLGAGAKSVRVRLGTAGTKRVY